METLPGPRPSLSPSLTRGPNFIEGELLMATRHTLWARTKMFGWTPLMWLNEQNWRRIEAGLDG